MKRYQSWVAKYKLRRQVLKVLKSQTWHFHFLPVSPSPSRARFTGNLVSYSIPAPSWSNRTVFMTSHSTLCGQVERKTRNFCDWRLANNNRHRLPVTWPTRFDPVQILWFCVPSVLLALRMWKITSLVLKIGSFFTHICAIQCLLSGIARKQALDRATHPPAWLWTLQVVLKRTSTDCIVHQTTFWASTCQPEVVTFGFCECRSHQVVISPS